MGATAAGNRCVPRYARERRERAPGFHPVVAGPHWRRLNGKEMQRSGTDLLIFDVPALIAYTTAFTELVPGDVISTGTPGGVGFKRNPPVWMKAGDVFEVEVTGVGVLSNPVVDEG
jgi:2-keto-4-pentenoate hydratase/2-oxohepta-3-ene-1,7-dioic acid hydratase in catechol pathway